MLSPFAKEHQAHHELRPAALATPPDRPRRLDQSAAARRSRIPSDRESSPQTGARQETHSPHRRSAATPGRQRQAPRRKGTRRDSAPSSRRTRSYGGTAHSLPRNGTTATDARLPDGLACRRRSSNWSCASPARTRPGATIASRGALANLGHRSPIRQSATSFREHGIEPTPPSASVTPPGRHSSKHIGTVLAAVDFTTIEVWTRDGLVTIYLLFAMEVATRRVHFAGCTDCIRTKVLDEADCPEPDRLRRRIPDRPARYRTHGPRYEGFATAFRFILRQLDVRPVTLPARSPNLNAHMERFMRSLKDEFLRRMIFFGENVVAKGYHLQFVEHYHHERNHQGLANRLIEPGDEVGKTLPEVRCRERLGGLLKYYHRDAA